MNLAGNVLRLIQNFDSFALAIAGSPSIYCEILRISCLNSSLTRSSHHAGDFAFMMKRADKMSEFGVRWHSEAAQRFV